VVHPRSRPPCPPTRSPPYGIRQPVSPPSRAKPPSSCRWGRRSSPRDVCGSVVWGVRPLGAAYFPTLRVSVRCVGSAALRGGVVPHAARGVHQCLESAPALRKRAPGRKAADACGSPHII
jgi:hypothetical protein